MIRRSLISNKKEIFDRLNFNSSFVNAFFKTAEKILRFLKENENQDAQHIFIDLSDIVLRSGFINKSYFHLFADKLSYEELTGPYFDIYFDLMMLGIKSGGPVDILYFYLSKYYFENKNLSECIKYTDLAVDYNHLRWQALMYKALCFYKQKDYDTAAAIYHDILKVDKNNPSINNNLAYLYAIKKNDCEKALPYARLAVKGKEESGQLHTLGYILWKSGPEHFDEAEKVLLESSSMGKEMAFFHLSQFYFEINNIPQSIFWLDKTLMVFDLLLKDNADFDNLESLISQHKEMLGKYRDS